MNFIAFYIFLKAICIVDFPVETHKLVQLRNKPAATGLAKLYNCLKVSHSSISNKQFDNIRKLLDKMRCSNTANGPAIYSNFAPYLKFIN